MPNSSYRRQLLAQSSLSLGRQSGAQNFQRDANASGHSAGRDNRQTAGQTPASVNVICLYAQGVYTRLSRQQCRAPKRVTRQGVTDRLWAFRVRISHLCEKPGQTGGQKATLRGHIQAFVSYAIPARCATHIGPPPYPLHAPSVPPPYLLHAPAVPKLCQYGVSARQTGRRDRAGREWRRSLH